MNDLSSAETASRLKVLQDLAVLDTPPEQEFDDITALAARICMTPVALVSLVDESRQWFKSRHGLDARETPLEHSFCVRALQEPAMLVVPDAREDPRFADNPAVTGPPHVRFYAGAPLRLPEGVVIGTLCVIDFVPRQLTDVQLRDLRVLAREVVTHLDLRRRARRLEESEARYRQFFERNPQPIWVRDPESARILAANEAAVAFYGYSKDEFRRMGTGDLVAAGPEDGGAGPAARTEWHRLKCGRIARMEVTTNQLELDGRPAEMVLACDLTERERSAAELAEVQRLQRSLLESVDEGILGLDADGRVVFLNPAGEAILGSSEGEMIGRPVHAVVRRHPQESGGFPPPTCPIVETLADGRTRRVDNGAFCRNDGSGFPAEFHCSAVRGADGAITGAVVSFQDISERKRAHEKLREQAELLDKAQDAILVRDMSHLIRYWNKSAERLYGWRADEVLGRPVKQLLYDDQKAYIAATRVTLDNGEWNGELEHTSRDGGKLAVECRWTLLCDDDGQPKSILSIDTDITARKNLEHQFQRAQRMESIGTLAGGIAHDLNNVLAPIMMGIDLLKLAERDPLRLEILSTLERSSRRGADMVKQVLTFARGAEGAKKEVRVDELLAEIGNVARDTFGTGIRVDWDIPPDLWTVRGDATQLHQVFMNLCVNAREAMPDGGILRMAARNLPAEQVAEVFADAAPTPGPLVLVEVTDTGVGMPREVAGRIFEPFFTTRELGRGTGLGLSTTLAIVRSHGGFMRVDSAPGRGTVMRVCLPTGATCPAAADDAAGDADELPHGHGELVLVVDDEAAVRGMTCQTLEAFGYQTLAACDGMEAVALHSARKGEIALVLTDMMMPVMDGPAAIHALLREEPGLPVIAVSGLLSDYGLKQAADAGVKHFLSKPCATEVLLQALKRALAGH